MKKIKPFLLPGLLGFYVVFSISMIFVAKQMGDAGVPDSANPVIIASWLLLISQLCLASVWAGFGPEPWLQRIPLCTLCGLLSLLAFEQTCYLMFGHTSHHYRSPYDQMYVVLLSFPVLVVCLCCVRAIPWLSWQLVRYARQPSQQQIKNQHNSRGRIFLLITAAVGILFAADWMVIPGGCYRFITRPNEYLDGLDFSLNTGATGPALLLAIGMFLGIVVALSRFADWLFYRRYWTLPLFGVILLSWLLWCTMHFETLKLYPVFMVLFLITILATGAILPLLLLGMTGYRLQSCKRPSTDDQYTENTRNETSQNRVAIRSRLDGIVIVGSFAFMIVVVPTGFMSDLIATTRVDRVHHTIKRLSKGRVTTYGHNDGYRVSAELVNGDFVDDDLSVLTQLDELYHLKILNSNITDAGLVHLEGLTNLESLTIGSSKITDAGLAHIKGLKNLSRLTLYCNQVSDAGLEHLKGLNLWVFELDSDQINGSGLKELRGSKNLHMVKMSGKNLTDQVFENLSHFADLRTIYLDSPELQGDGLEELRHLRNLTTLKIGVFSNEGTSNLNPDYAEHLQHLSLLEDLELPNTFLNDNSLKHIGELQKMKSLNLRNSHISDAGLVHLEGLANLAYLSLSGTEVTDVGLVHLKGLTNLEVLDLTGTKVSDAAVTELENTLPTTIYHSNGPGE